MKTEIILKWKIFSGKNLGLKISSIDMACLRLVNIYYYFIYENNQTMQTFGYTTDTTDRM